MKESLKKVLRSKKFVVSDFLIKIAYEKKLKTPIINAIFSVLYEGKDAEKQFEKLTAKLN